MEERKSINKWYRLATYYNTYTGFVNVDLAVSEFDFGVKINVVFTISPVKTPGAKPGTVGAYDHQRKIQYSLSETELSAFVPKLRAFLTMEEFEYKFQTHFTQDKRYWTNLSFKKKKDVKGAIFNISSNKNSNDERYSAAITLDEMKNLYFNLLSVAQNLAILKVKFISKKEELAS